MFKFGDKVRIIKGFYRDLEGYLIGQVNEHGYLVEIITTTSTEFRKIEVEIYEEDLEVIK
jgi:DNA-directed RNA polymerase specialized sigma54-like protein